MKNYYIETSIPSFYFDTRTNNVRAQAMREWTREWWHLPKNNYSFFIGIPVIIELERTPEPKRTKCLQFVKDVQVLDYAEAIDEIIATYIHHKLMPKNEIGDAAHLAIASYYKCDFLVTWNCSHIANPNKFDHINRINTLLNLYTPKLVTPYQLLEE